VKFQAFHDSVQTRQGTR